MIKVCEQTDLRMSLNWNLRVYPFKPKFPLKAYDFLIYVALFYRKNCIECPLP